MTFCDMLTHVTMRRCLAGIADKCLYNVHTFLHQSTNSVVNRTVWRTQIWRNKVRCFLLKEVDCFTIIEYTRHFRRSYFKANKVSKSEGTRKIEHAIISKTVLMAFTKNYQN